MMVQASRRELLQAMGALVVVASVRAEAASGATATINVPGKTARKTIDPTELDAWIAISVEGEVTAFLGKGDVGQGIEVAIAQIVAEELDLKVDQVQVVLADTALTCDLGGVAGSNGILRGGAALRKAAAEARRVLVDRAAQRLAVPVSTLTVRDGAISAPGKPGLTYGQLVESNFKTRLGWNGQYRNALEISGKAKPKSPDKYTVVGTSPPRRDVEAKVFGHYEYSADVRVPGMLHGRVIRPQVAGSRIISVDKSSIADITGARVVRKGDFLGVLADREWDAIQAATALKVIWEARPAPFFASDSLHDHIRKAPVVKRVVVKDVGSVDDAFAKATTLVEAEYEWPFQSHAGMGPACAVADVRPDGVTLWNPSQKTHASAEGVAKLLGRPLESVRSIYCQGPGSYGRNDSGDATADAALMSSLCGRPVRVQGMRVDAQGWDPKAPASTHRARAVVKDGKLVAYEYVSKAFTRQDVSSFESEAYDLLAGLQTGFKNDPAPVFMAPEDGYAAPNLRSAWEVIPALLSGPSPLRTSNMRDPLGIQVHFASESFIDECALAAGVDPVAFRLAHIADPRHRAVIEAAAKLAGWQAGPPGARRSRTDTAMVGRGIAYGIRGGTIVATVCEVEVSRESGRVWPRRFWVAHDCGLVVNPETLKHVIEGNVGFATSRALFEEVTFDADNVTSLDWSSYPILDIGDAPQSVDIMLINRPEIPPTGAGEAASRPVAPAIANAIFDATGVRLRRAPFTADRMKAALSQL